MIEIFNSCFLVLKNEQNFVDLLKKLKNMKIE